MRYIQPHTPPARFPSVPFTAPWNGAFNPDEPALEEGTGYYEDLCHAELEEHLKQPCTVLLYRLYETEHPEHGPIEVRDLQVAQALTFSTVEEALAFVDAATEAQDACAKLADVPSALDGLVVYDFEIVPVGITRPVDPDLGSEGRDDVTPPVTCAGLPEARRTICNCS